MNRLRHDLPLVVFTWLAIAGGGTIAVSFLGEIAGRRGGASAVLIGSALVAAAVVASLGHLGRPLRAPLAASGLGRSPVSNEVLLAVLTVSSAALAASGWGGESTAVLARLAALLLAPALLASIGAVYRAGGQLAWTGASACSPLAAGLLVGAFATNALAPDGQGAALWALTGLTAVDAAVVALRWRSFSQSVRRVPAPEQMRISHAAWMAARVALLDIAPLASAALGAPVLAACLAAAGLLADRAGFYLTALQHTTEAEIGRVERLLEGARSGGSSR
jgi:anaerobic dimethyl sulfoxide reductase subunit C (anchor subunit)